MKKTKRVISSILALTMLASITACGGGGSDSTEPAATSEPVTLTLAHIRPDGSPADLAIEAFCAEANELSGGTLNFEIYPASQLGEYTTVMERVMIGDVDMQISTVGTNIDKFFGISSAPYIAATWEDARGIFESGSVMSKAYEEKMAEYDLKYLSAFPLYFGGIALGKEPVDPTNPDAKNGIKIRVPSMTSFEKTATELGYLGTPLPSSETFTSMQTGVVEGAIGMGAEGYYSNMADLVKYYLPINDHFETWHAYMNMDRFNSLSLEQQDALKTAAQNMEAKRWEVAEAETAEYEQKLADNGTTIVEYTDEQLNAIADKIREKVWPIIAEEYGADKFAEITATVGK